MIDTRLVELLNLVPLPSEPRVLLYGGIDKPFVDSLKERSCSVEQASGDIINRFDYKSFDLIVAFLKNRSIHRQITRFEPYLHQYGAFIIITKNEDHPWKPARKRSLLETKKQLFGTGFKDINVYGLTPSLEEVRLVVPLEKGGFSTLSLALYQPSLKLAKLRKYVAFFLSYLGMSHLWIPYSVILARRISSEHELELETILNTVYKTKTTYALFTGTPGYLRKPTVQVMSETGKIIGYGKIGINPQTASLIKHEANMLESLNGMHLGRAKVPGVQFYGDLFNGTPILLQSSCKSTLSSSPLRPRKMHLEFLKSLFDETRTVSGENILLLKKTMHQRLTLINKGENDEWLQLMERSLEAFFSWAMQTDVPLCLAHRDFTPWNTYSEKGRLFVFDWEFAEMLWPPMVDAFHFIIQKGILVDHETPGVLLKRIFNPTSKEGTFISRLMSVYGFSKDARIPLLSFYLSDIASQYLCNFKFDTKISRDGEKLLKVWSSMLSNTLNIMGR